MIEVERLQAKVTSMTKRIRQLEKALAVSHIASSSVEPHPLLLSFPLEEDDDDSDGSPKQVDSSSDSIQAKSEYEALLDNSIMESFRRLTIASNKGRAENVFDMAEASPFVSSWRSR